MWRIIETAACVALIMGIVAAPGCAQTPWTSLPVTAGLVLDSEEDNGLMFKQSDANPCDLALTSHTIDGNRLAFSGIPAGDVGDHGLGAGHSALGIVPEPSTVRLLCLPVRPRTPLKTPLPRSFWAPLTLLGKGLRTCNT